MHELPVTEQILEIALRHAKEANASMITDLYLVIGQWSSIVDDSVAFYWEIVTEETIAQGSCLHFRRLPTLLECEACKNQYHPTEEVLACPECGSTAVKVLNGNEFYLEAIDVK
jgi:hydrogenase nickel incorporation protein HypA/HybF